MRRRPAWGLALGVLVGWACWPAAAGAGVWLTLAAGMPGADAPTSTQEFDFDTMHGPQLVAVNQLTGTGVVEAGAGGATTFFGGSGVPVVLSTADGSAYVAGGGAAPEAAKSRGPGGGSAGPRSSAAPDTSGTVPSAAALLGITTAAPDAAGNQSLTATVTDGAGNTLGSATVTVPTDGWWVIGLGPAATPGPTDPGPTDPGPTDPGPTNPGPTDPGPTNPNLPDDGGAVGTPEPGTLGLVAAGGLGVGAWRKLRRRVG